MVTFVPKEAEMSNCQYDDLKHAESIASEKVSLIKSDLERRLYKWFASSKQMEHGQVKSAARYVMANLGPDWVLQENAEDKHVRMYVRMEVRRLVIGVVGRWHKDPKRIWRDFRSYCLEMAALAKAKQTINRVKSNG